MGVAAMLQAAIAGRLGASSAFTGIFDEVPARAAFPYVVVHCPEEKAWNVDGMEGRQLQLELTLWDDQPSRLARDEKELSVPASAISPLPGWQLSSFIELTRQRYRDATGPWNCKVTYRARVAVSEMTP